MYSKNNIYIEDINWSEIIMDKKYEAIGVLDSGLGGLSVLREAIKIMPNENFIFFGDSKNAPYGVKSVEQVRKLTFDVVEYLLSRGVKGIMVACNTATSAAVAELRIKYPNLPIVGIEPALKPAVNNSKDGKILVMATPMTLKEAKFHKLLDRYRDKREIEPVPCGGLMEYVEQGILEGDELDDYLREKLEPFMDSKISSIVLGCTHYPFVKNAIEKVVGQDVDIIDGSLGTARELMRRLKEKDLLNDSKEKGTIEMINSSNKQELIDLSWKLIEM